MWSGPLEDIPDGWALCNGANGTPNLSTYFIRSAHPALPPGTTGGKWNHIHTLDVGAHEHSHSASALSASPSLDSGDKLINSEPDGHYMESTYGHTHQITVNPDMHDHDAIAGSTDLIPRFYALAFIMKL